MRKLLVFFTGNSAINESGTERVVKSSCLTFKRLIGSRQKQKIKKYLIFLIPLFLIMIGTKNMYSQVRQVNHCIVIKTYCAIPACINKDSITDLDRVKMMYDDRLECTEKVIGTNRCLTITTYYPQQQRFENDHQYMIGKSVTSVAGTALYDHEGDELVFNADYNELYILTDEYVENYGIYTHVFTVIDKDDAIINLQNAGFQEVYEYEGFVIAMLETFELAINFDEFIIETRVFHEDDGKLKNLHRTNYANTGGHIIPIEETMVKYDVLPSGIPYEITEVKSYLFYQVMQNGNDIVTMGEEQSYENYLYDLQHKSIQKSENIKQFEDILKRKTKLKVFPNPTEEQITVELPFYINDNVVVTLYNTLGVAVMSKHHSKGEQVEFDIRSLPAGVYVVRCVKNDKVVSTRFVKF